MTISTTTNRIVANGNGTTTAFPVTFPFHAQEDLVVVSTEIATGAQTTKLLGTEYTITGITDTLGYYSSGGTVNFLVAPAAGERITIYRDPVRLQELDLQDASNFPAESIEAQFDYLTMLIQRNADLVARALTQPDGDSTTIDRLPSTVERASKFLAFDANGDPVAAAGTSANLGPVSSFIDTLLVAPDAPTVRSILGVAAAASRDDDFRITGSDDPSKRIAFEVDGLTTATTRTYAAPDRDGTLALTTDGFTTGDVKLTFKTTADATWVMMDDGTIGSALSGATTRAHADTEALYTVLWNNIVDQWAPVVGGRGVNAAADFSAHKPMRLPRVLGRALAGCGVGVVLESGGDSDVDVGTDQLTVPSNTAKWITGMPVVFTLTSGTITGLTSGNTYYVIRISTTAIQLASSLANAQNGTAINMTAKSSPLWTITHTYPSRSLGEAAGEATHAMTITELLSHTHQMYAVTNTAGAIVVAGGDKGITTNTHSRGGNAAMNIIQPTAFLNVMIKL